VETFAGRFHVEWDPDAAVTPRGQFPFFIEFLKVSGFYDTFVETASSEVSQIALMPIKATVSFAAPFYSLRQRGSAHPARMNKKRGI